jgi:hypothetical protein
MLSLPKILLVLAVLAAVIIGTRLFRSLSSPADKKAMDREPDADHGNGAVDLIECATCGDFVKSESGCDREDCPSGKT